MDSGTHSVQVLRMECNSSPHHENSGAERPDGGRGQLSALEALQPERRKSAGDREVASAGNANESEREGVLWNTRPEMRWARLRWDAEVCGLARQEEQRERRAVGGLGNRAVSASA